MPADREMTLDLLPAARSSETGTARQRRGRYIATVAANVALCREHNRLTLRIARFPPSAPGQFVQVKCRDVDDAPLGAVEERVYEWTTQTPEARARATRHPDLFRPTPILRRPFSIAGRRSTSDGDEIDLINRDIGPGTNWLSTLRVGQEVDLIGPLGNTFAFDDSGGPALLVGGGVGIPPMIYVAQALAALNAAAAGQAQPQRRAMAFCGALSIDLLPLTIADTGHDDLRAAGEPVSSVAEFAECGFETVISTDDGSYGYRGRVSEALVGYLDRHPLDEGAPRPTLYTCGPEPMMKAVAAIARDRGLRCQVAVERAMACGMGTCQSCVIREAAANDRGWLYRLACTDGPIFEAATLLW